MEIARETTEANVIRAWEPGRVRIGQAWFEGHLVVAADRIITGWTVASPADVGLAALQPALDLDPEIVLLGTGAEILLPDTGLMAALAARSVGLEIMSTPAACRTFNVLLHEERRVVAALFNPPEG
ncbi:MAG TPA: MTH938/NDUFAF3 family protein [Gammaproteobacteria bacterium]